MEWVRWEMGSKSRASELNEFEAGQLGGWKR
jgi:hypothetical protein